ncbi:NlpC/P60 family protein [Corynebacterium sp. HS2168-gen11]|uniref:NlpC/P60 family protein n=1 Tax=Corynebacterium sp. HS2168-gen11 TaxID=2974027 RepID=UPI00216ACA57|nr:NlpC/P60 family protein [Corynebacterium sp. HS2168-gen11]MCS4536170.1 NlpC/P60 family protein [Corynebacterium sp. HS2168-gen11]
MNIFRKCVVVAICGTLAFPTSISSVYAQDLETLIAEMSATSAEASAKNEEVKQLELDLEKAETELVDIERDAEEKRTAAAKTKQLQALQQDKIDELALVKYQGAAKDPVFHVLGSKDPKLAIDRSSYLSMLARSNERAAKRLAEQTEQANGLHKQAEEKVDVAKQKRDEIQQEFEKLERERKELEAKILKIQEQVSALSPEDRLRWMTKNGPVTYTLSDITSTNEAGLEALKAGMTKVGSPYSWGATGPNEFDCSGLVVWSYQQIGKTIPRTSQAQMLGGVPIPRDQLQPGDVVAFYPGATHVGIYAGDNKVLHSSDYGIPVQVVDMGRMPFYGARRY